jgi:hypothetical protein
LHLLECPTTEHFYQELLYLVLISFLQRVVLLEEVEAQGEVEEA